ncbi:MAG TPA: trypsin-like peptidase domain-containing protein, partial [Dehalococcoidia bacterium]|nr:trypsin-like peptidase domain-containing protein [Dehalococcoidia bacterium]
MATAAAAATPNAASMPPFSSSGATSSAGLITAIRQVVQEVKPAVVQITNEQVPPDQFGGVAVPAGVGSGVIYDGQGHILTNNHVVEGAQQLQVSLPDGRSFSAKLVGRDAQTDLAVVQISGSNLPTAALGDSTTLQTGEWVVAIGNALALPGGPTVTQGVVSALGRTVQEPPAGQAGGNGPGGGAAGPFLFDLIQTDAPINPGNSGGPLINAQGQVVGVNSQIYSQTGGFMGVAFAIPIDIASKVARELKDKGKVTRGWLGVVVQEVDRNLAKSFNLPKPEGALVARVLPDSPAQQAGLKAGDV